MNEAQTRKDLIDPAIEKAGWTKANGCQVLVEQSAVEFSPGRGSGKYLAVENFEVVLLEVLSKITKARIAPRIAPPSELASLGGYPRLRQESFPRAGDSGFRPCRNIVYQNSDVQCKRGKSWRIAA